MNLIERITTREVWHWHVTVEIYLEFANQYIICVYIYILEDCARSARASSSALRASILISIIISLAHGFSARHQRDPDTKELSTVQRLFYVHILRDVSLCCQVCEQFHI